MNPVPLAALPPLPCPSVREPHLRPDPFSYHILSMPDATPAIAVRDLRKVYDGKAAVDGLSLTVARGSFFGFLGPNGAGKSTTIRMLTGLIPATSGSIELLGLPMPAEEMAIKQRIGLVPDESLLFDRLTGAEFLEFVGRMYNLPRPLAVQRANELLELFELSNERRKLIAEYSKGMRKRVAMAASLIHRPELFLMDEPFEGVDAVGARLMKDILLDQVRHGATIFLTSHVLEVVERLCDHAAIINEGRIVAEGRMQDLRAGSETLEDVFVRIVGRGREYDRLEWLS
jgi:ABC-2 type transport system ATP-binding protein